MAEQIHESIASAIREGRLLPGARLPSWRDLASQLGLARGTVRIAYERLSDAQLIIASKQAGTRVATLPPLAPREAMLPDPRPLPEIFRDFSARAGMFQMAVPAQDAFPFTSWSRIVTRAAKAGAAAPAQYPDPRGEPELRQEIAAYLAISRGISCSPSQIFVTGGYAGALGLTTRVLGVEGSNAWMEEPGYPITRTALTFAHVTPVPVRVDGEGLDVAHGIALCPDAKLAIVTAGQQAPLGVTMSLARRHALLEWAIRHGGWIIEDDYLSELQLKGRAAPALASLDHAGRVIHIGTFSKTISPALRLGFLVAPPMLASRFGEAAACLAPAPGPIIQLAVAAFIREGHYLRHLRRMKRLYESRRDLLLANLTGKRDQTTAGLAILLRLPEGANDTEIALQALTHGLAPVPLSTWYASPGSRQAGLLLSFTNLSANVAESCARLESIIAEYS
ncbi:PLP-dependent aminotransferase family protein [Sphingobium sp. CFD-2]|uniref:MocR-like pyridoxine biosynthesis transcription factor PdxR n=1 Tax=Sphingobium sp. CFD-2 TaxID=2878542 RepID=UPI00214C6CE4|nr:PLP-dependent aminotransferase family protein [Sphingobium sp. CFD-2]